MLEVAALVAGVRFIGGIYVWGRTVHMRDIFGSGRLYFGLGCVDVGLRRVDLGLRRMKIKGVG
eukprot:10607981-Lingulodinium_polyedra.AAC.1